MRDRSVTSFKSGLVDNVEAQSIPDGAASSSLNWLTRGDRVELRRGYSQLGPIECATGTGRNSGLGVAVRNGGGYVAFRKRKRILEAYQSSVGRWNGVGYEASASAKHSYGTSATHAQSLTSAPTIYRAGQTISVSEDFRITSATFQLRKAGSPTGMAYAKVFLCGDSGLPDDAAVPVAVSDPVDVSTLGPSFAPVTLTFSGSNRAVLERCSTYAVVFESNVSVPPDYVEVGYVEEEDPDGDLVLFDFTWIDWPARSCVFSVSGQGRGLILPEAAEDDEMSFAPYASNAGAMVFASSPNSGLYKIMLANPYDYADTYDAARNFKGRIAINENRMELWGRNEDKTGLYGSWIDRAAYTTVSNEAIGTGDGSTKTFAATLAFKGGGARRTCFGLVVTDGTESFRDDYDGNLVGSAGGTGTVNYMTGEVSVTFAAAPAAVPGNVKATYQWEDTNDGGVTDFTKSAPRLAGEGFVFRQDDGGGELMGVAYINSVMFCFHKLRTWSLDLSIDDTDATNKPYRMLVGIPTHKAFVATSDGIYYIDTTNGAKPLLRKLYLSPNTTEVLPQTVTQNVDLSGYTFDDCWMEDWGDYVAFAGRTSGSAANNRLFVFHKTWKSVDVLSYLSTHGKVFEGTLILGDSVTEAVYRAFSGFDDDDSSTENYWIGNVSDHGYPGWLKKCKRYYVEGEIQSDQALEVYYSDDRGGFVLAGTVDGNGPYVDKGSSVSIGSNTVGSKEVGGGGDGATAYHYFAELRIPSDKYEVRQMKYVATGLGYVSVSRAVDHDIRLRKQKMPRKYRDT